MAVFELVLALLLGGVLLALVAPRLGVPWPALLALAGSALAFVPGMPEVALDPGLALALFVAPVLLDAAFDASPRDLRANWVPVGGLVLGAVGLTVAAVACVARWLDPGMPWAAAVALGAIVAPPDAAAATAVLRLVRLPHRIMVILEGESMLNDASALLIFRVALGAVAGGLTAWSWPWLAVEAFGGVVLGFVLARAYIFLTARVVGDGAPAVVLQFLGTFGVWLLADGLGLSAVLTVVAYALTIARLAPMRMGARQRRASYAVWDVAVFVLNVLAFVLVGLQLRGIVKRLDGAVVASTLFAGAILATCVVVRMVWVGGFYASMRALGFPWIGEPAPGEPGPTVRGAIVIGWSGMRGIVTLAAAFALPPAFPARDLLVFAAFCVVLGTLVLQGLTLRPLLWRLALPRDDSIEREIALARAETARAALATLDGTGGPIGDGEAQHLLRREYEARLQECVREGSAGEDATGLATLRVRALAAERSRLMALRREERIGDDAFHRLEEELDWAQAEWEGR